MAKTRNYSHIHRLGWAILSCFVGLVFIFTPLLVCFLNKTNENDLDVNVAAARESTIPNSLDEWPRINYNWQTENLNGHDFYYTYMGEYPQTYVGDETNAVLEDGFARGSIKETGNSFYIENDAYDNIGLSRYYKEYQYNDKKVVRVESQKYFPFKGNLGDTIDELTFSTGEKMGPCGTAKWFYVEPIKWWIIDGTNPTTLTEISYINVMSDMILAAVTNEFMDDVYSIYTWLSGWSGDSSPNFYNDSKLSALKLSKVKDVGLYSTTPNVWLPSQEEMINEFSIENDVENKLFLSSHAETLEQSRLAETSDFARSTYCLWLNDLCYQNDESFLNNPLYWLNPESPNISLDGKFTSSGASGDLFGAVGARPAMTIPYNPNEEYTYSTLDCVLSTSSSDPDIYISEYDLNKFYIKSAKGFKLLSLYTQTGMPFNPNWIFSHSNTAPLDVSDIGTNVPQIGSEDNPFVSQFGSSSMEDLIIYKRSNFVNGDPFYDMTSPNLKRAKFKKYIPLDEITTDSNDPDIYKTVVGDKTDFHIKSAIGFLSFMSFADKNTSSSLSQTFDPNWTFYLDNDIYLVDKNNGVLYSGYCSTYSSSYCLSDISESNFPSMFDGRGHIIVSNSSYFSNGTVPFIIQSGDHIKNVLLFKTYPLDKLTPSDNTDPDIYWKENEQGNKDFHIKSTDGFIKLMQYAGGGEYAFDPSWTIYLDTDIYFIDENNKGLYPSLNQSQNMLSAIYENSLSCVFDGQGHTIIYSVDYMYYSRTRMPFVISTGERIKNITQLTRRPLTKVISQNKNDPNIYWEQNSQGKVMFHVKSSTGYNKIVDFSDGGRNKFDENWEFCLDSDIDFTAEHCAGIIGGTGTDNSYIPLHEFENIFDGKNYYIKYYTGGLPTEGLFKTIDDSNIKNINYFEIYSLTETVSSDPENPDIYQVKNGEKIEFHIKSFDGFAYMRQYTLDYDPNWTFYLENDLFLVDRNGQLDANLKKIGAYKTFTSVFDGKNHRIIYDSNNPFTTDAQTKVINVIFVDGLPLTEIISSDPNNPNAFWENGKNEGEIYFHIITAEGFIDLTKYKGAFDSNWTFYLENDIDLRPYGTFTPIASQSQKNLFLGTFDGKNHKISFTGVFNNSAPSACLFGYIGECNIQNLKIYADLPNGGFGLAYGATISDTHSEEIPNTSTNISHVTIEGRITGTIGSALMGMAYPVVNFNLYDVNICLSELKSTQKTGFLFASTFWGINVNFSSCNFICHNTNAIGLFSSFVSINLSFACKNTLIDINVDYDQESNFVVFGMETAAYGAAPVLPDLIGVEIRIHSNTGKLKKTYIMGIDGKIPVSENGQYEDDTYSYLEVRMYDCAFICDNLSYIIGSNGAEINYSKKWIHSFGVYIHDLVNNKTTIINPDFTPSKWCQYDEMNGGLPMLREFVWMGDYLPEYDMQSWAQEQLNG